MKHGTNSMYSSGCRCMACKDAHNQVAQTNRYKRYARKVPPGLHGKRSTYCNWGCRCEACTNAHMEYEIPYHKQRMRERAGNR